MGGNIRQLRCRPHFVLPVPTLATLFFVAIRLLAHACGAVNTNGVSIATRLKEAPSYRLFPLHTFRRTLRCLQVCNGNVRRQCLGAVFAFVFSLYLHLYLHYIDDVACKYRLRHTFGCNYMRIFIRQALLV